MEHWKYLTIKYGGQWNDCTYVGRSEQITQVLAANPSLVNLRYNIDVMLQGYGMSTQYELHYLSHSRRTGRNIKSILSTESQFAQLCSTEQYPSVYVTHIAADVYVPHFEEPHSSSFGYDLGGCAYDASYTEEMNRMHSQLTGSAWFDEAYDHGGNYSSTSTHYHGSTSAQQEEIRATTANNEPDSCEDAYGDGSGHDYDDDSYVLESDDLDTDSDADEQTEEIRTEMACMECSAWIRDNLGLTADDIATWLVPVIPVNATVALVARENGPLDDADLCVGAIFESKDDLNIAGGLWHMEIGAEYHCSESDKKRLKWICKRVESCPFQMRASCSRRSSLWKVHKWNDNHTCIRQLGRQPPRKVHMNVIAAYVSRKIRRECKILEPKAIVEEILREYGIIILYDLANRARHRAIEMIYGGFEGSYQMLPGYLHMLKKTNPGTMTDLVVGDDGKFEHLFVALGACRLAYPINMGPVIAIDGTHLKGKNRGILFIAVTKDANEHVFPLAIGVGPIENDISWKWFLSRFKVAYGELAQTLIVSDAHISIANAVNDVFPLAAHATCYYHLLGKVKTHGKVVTKLFEQASYTYREKRYDHCMANLRLESETAFQYLMEVGPQMWSRVHCPLPRFSQLTSNAAETWNGRLDWARRLPICSMLDAIRHIIETWFDERRVASHGDDEVLTSEAEKKLNVKMSKGLRMSATHGVGSTFNVSDGRRSFAVDLDMQTCTCCEFQADAMPCSHAIAAILKQGQSTIYDYVAWYYKRAAWSEAYKFPINRVPHKEDWNIPIEIGNILVLPPKYTPQAGRPRNSRRRGATERPNRNRRDRRTRRNREL